MEDNMTVTDGEEFTIATLTETEDSKFCIDEEEFQFAWHFNNNSSSWYVLYHLSSWRLHLELNDDEHDLQINFSMRL